MDRVNSLATRLNQNLLSVTKRPPPSSSGQSPTTLTSGGGGPSYSQLAFRDWKLSIRYDIKVA